MGLQHASECLKAQTAGSARWTLEQSEHFGHTRSTFVNAQA